MSAQLFKERIALKILILGDRPYGQVEMVRLVENWREREWTSWLLSTSSTLGSVSLHYHVKSEGRSREERYQASNIKTSFGVVIFQYCTYFWNDIFALVFVCMCVCMCTHSLCVTPQPHGQYLTRYLFLKSSNCTWILYKPTQAQTMILMFITESVRVIACQKYSC